MDGLEQFKQTFFQECEELLADLEGQLLALREGSADVQHLHAAFRAIHSIKGGAGAFGFDRLVSFAHTFETVLDLLRDGRVALNAELVTLSIRAGDILADLVTAARTGTEPPPGQEDQVLAALAAAAGIDPGQSSEGEDFDLDFTPITVDLDEDSAPAVAEAAPAAPHVYRIRFRPRTEMLRRANEPLLIIRELKEVGSLAVTADLSALPDFAAIDPEAAYLAWTFELTTTAERGAVEEVFEFVLDDCALEISEAEPSAVSAETGLGDAAPAEPRAAEPERVPEAEPEPEPAPAPVAAAAKAAVLPAAGPESRPAPSETTPAVTSIRVDLDRVDRLVNMVGELVITQAMVSQQIDQSLADALPNLVQGLEQLFHHTRSLQDAVMAIRAQPVHSVFARMPRLVRDLCTQTGKRVHLEMSGESTEIDKTVIEQLNDPLTHMIRNAVDHGIEPAEEREALGKPAEGTIHLSAEQRGGRIVIQVADDGRGIDRERVRRKAIEKNLIAADAGLSDEEIDNLIFLPGFSTAEKVSNISGRGVGMDVVRQNIQKLGGRVGIRSRPGRGSRIELTLPLTLAVLDGMTVRVGQQAYIVPLTNVTETLCPAESDLDHVPGSGDILKIRGEYIKLIEVQRVLRIGTEAPASGRLVVIVEAEGGQRVGLMVDEILGQQQVVIKSLEENFDAIPGIAGATILGDGQVALILDVTAIRELSRSPETASGRSRKAQFEHEESPA